jgi:quercetin dioxygenase-like cupin family protein
MFSETQIAQVEGKMPNKIVFVPASQGQAYYVMGSLFTNLVTGAESGGSYYTLEVIVGPGGGPPPHIHHREEEQFYVLEGELTYQVGDQTFQVSPGDFVHIPRETVHLFKNGPTQAKLLATFSPAGIEGFFREVGEPVQDRSAPLPPVTQATIARFLAVESSGWRDHHETLPPPVTK